VLVLGLGYVLQRHDFYGLFLKPVLIKNVGLVSSYYKSLSINPEKLTINIKHKDYLKLAYKRQEALKIDRLFYHPEDWVPATAEYQGKTYKIDLRLKGMGNEHWKHEYEWSFKIKVKGKNTLFGMKRFALQSPERRLFMNEWYWHKLLKYTGLIYLRYDFVDVTVNGRHFPIYAVEENFEKRLLENNRLREGPIFMAQIVSFLNPGRVLLKKRTVKIYQSSKYNQIPKFIKLAHLAESRIEAYRQGKLPFSNVFDVDKMGMLLALSDLVETRHGIISKNLRYYFNPVNNLIEPIAYDMNIYESRIPTFSFLGSRRRFGDHEKQDSDWTWPFVAFQDKLLFKKYIESLEKISDKNFLDQFFLETHKEGQEKIGILHKSFPYYEFKKKEVFYENLKHIRKQLQPKKSLNIYFNGVSKKERILYLDIANIHTFPVEILGTSIDGKILKPIQETIIQAFKDESIFHHTTPLIPTIKNMADAVLKEVKVLTNRIPMVPLKKTKANQKPKTKKSYGLEHEIVKFQIPEGFKWSDDLISRLQVVSRVYGAKFETSDIVIPWTQHEDLFMQPSSLNEIDFMSVEEEQKIIQIHQGAWTVYQDIIIPAGYKVTAEKGTNLNLINGAKILSYSPLEFIGSKDQPIIISSNGKYRQGIVVIQARDKSIIRHVVFDGLGNPRKGGWALTGAVTFYESPVLLSNVEFINNQSEDALNIIRSEFTLTDAVFRNIFSDALDSDFSNGVIKNVSFLICGNDGLDASGSKINVENIFLDGIGDKGVSAGEKSNIFIDTLSGKNSKIIVASKDHSEVVIQKAQVGHSQIGFTAFQKKSEFGPGYIKIKDLEIKNLETPFLVERGSVIQVDGVPIKAHEKDIGKLLYGD
jgi:hypothetical protein